MPKKIRIRDLSLRDGQQALTTGLMTTADIEGLLPHYREAGFHIMEVWGGDIPLTAVSVLDESPWHRLRVCADMDGQATPEILDAVVAHRLAVAYGGRRVVHYLPV